MYHISFVPTPDIMPIRCLPDVTRHATLTGHAWINTNAPAARVDPTDLPLVLDPPESQTALEPLGLFRPSAGDPVLRELAQPLSAAKPL